LNIDTSENLIPTPSEILQRQFETGSFEQR